jgi:hypothetical protein
LCPGEYQHGGADRSLCGSHAREPFLWITFSVIETGVDGLTGTETNPLDPSSPQGPSNPAIKVSNAEPYSNSKRKTEEKAQENNLSSSPYSGYSGWSPRRNRPITFRLVWVG